MSFGQDVGPPGVVLTLTKQGSREVVKTTETKPGGDFMFEKVLPGDYVVTATHQNWEFDIVSILLKYKIVMWTPIIRNPQVETG